MAQTPDLQIEIIHPNGRRETRILAGAKKIANIGSHPANEIVLLGAGIAEFHAILDYRQTPYKYLLLNGNQAVVEENLLLPEGGVTIGGYKLVLKPVQIFSSTVTTTPASPQININRTEQLGVGSPLSDVDFYIGEPQQAKTSFSSQAKPDNNIRIDVNEREQWVNLNQTATWTLIITNIGSRTARFAVELFGIDKDQKEHKIEPDADEARIQIQPELFNLNNQVSQSVTVKITPPRGNKSSRQGWYRLRVVISSADYPDSIQSFSELALRIRAYDAFDIFPPSTNFLPLRFRGRINNQLQLPVTNQGNRDLEIELTGSELERRCQIEFLDLHESKKPSLGSQRFAIPADKEKYSLPVRVTPYNRYWLGINRRKYELHFTAIEGERRIPFDPVLVEHRALLNPIVLALTLITLAALFLFALIRVLTPNLSNFTPKYPAVSYEPGQSVPLTWTSSTWWPQLMKIQSTDKAGGEQPPNFLSSNEIASKELNVVALEGNTYTLTLESQLVNWPWIHHVVSTSAIATLSPEISFTTISHNLIVITTTPPNEFIVGTPLTIRWDGPKEITTYTLRINDQGPISIVPFLEEDRQVGSYEDKNQQIDSRYLIEGKIPHRSKITAEVSISAVQPIPNIIYFRAEPTAISPGGNITLSWKVDGKTGTIITIDGVPAEENPGEATRVISNTRRIGTPEAFTLHAAYAGTQPSQAGHVEVTTTVQIVPPTPITPIPSPIATFLADPVNVVAGNSVTLSWSVKGVDEISISPSSVPKPEIEDRVAKGNVAVPMLTPGTSEFKLKAIASSTESTSVAIRIIKVNVVPPTGTPTPTPIPAAQGILRLEGAGKVTIQSKNSYQVPINTFANVVWEITNKIDGKTKTEIKNQSLIVLASGGDKGSVEVKVTRNSQYQLWATNDPNQQLVPIATIDVEVQVPPTPRAPFNVNVVIEDGIGVTSPATITWYLPPESVENIYGFRIYRSDNKDATGTLSPIIDELKLDKSARFWVDSLVPTCGKTYYVVAVYDTYTENGEPIRTQTNASENSFVNPACPSE